MTPTPKISVVVPAYKRPHFMGILIESYLVQDYPNKELVIVDDSGDDMRVAEMVKEHAEKNPSIKLIKNPENLGFCKNLIKSIVSGTGDYIMVLGDDDMIVDAATLSQMVKYFEDNKEVDFIYPNQIQFNNDYKADYVYPHFSETKVYEKGYESMANTWLLSSFISGIGLRKRDDFEELYPKDNTLFPQVEMVGKIVMEKQSMALNEYLIGSRAHNEQLGFKAVKGKDIKNNEKHSVYELKMILDRVLDYSKKHGLNSNGVNEKIINSFFENKHLTIFPGEKINAGNRAILRVFIQAVKNNPYVLINFRFLFYFLVAFILPSSILIKVKNWKKNQFMQSHLKESELYDSFIKKIDEFRSSN
jgi:glycosyltransferase involved in cell wall biosynthesis